MKLQKVYAIILGLALIAPQTSLQAITPRNTSWVSSLLSLGSKTITLPLTTLSFCYKNLFAGAILAGATYYLYRYHYCPWKEQRDTRLTASAKEASALIKAYCENPLAFQKQPQKEKDAHRKNLQDTLDDHSFTERFCAWIPSCLRSWGHRTFGFTRGDSAQHFFDLLEQTKRVKGRRTSAQVLDTSFKTIQSVDPLTRSHFSLLKMFNFKAEHAEAEAIGSYNARVSSSALNQVLQGNDESFDLALATPKNLTSV